MSGCWVDLPRHTPDEDGLDALRDLAAELCDQWMFHEVAMADPFEAERYVLRAGRLLRAVVGWQKGTRTYWEVDSA